jgi:hypothetical protein
MGSIVPVPLDLPANTTALLHGQEHVEAPPGSSRRLVVVHCGSQLGAGRDARKSREGKLETPSSQLSGARRSSGVSAGGPVRKLLSNVGLTSRRMLAPCGRS